MNLVKGNRYRVQYLPAGTRKPYELTGQYMGVKHTHGYPSEHYFNLRPAAGTTLLREDQIISTMETDQAIKAPRRL